MRIHKLAMVGLLSAAFALPASAQTIKKIGSDIHHTLQTAGKDVKEGAKDVGGATHHELKKAGNGTKTTLGNATGIHKVGGSVGKAARSVSRGGKHVARSAKHSLKTTKADAHADLTKDGKDTKAEIKKP